MRRPTFSQIVSTLREKRARHPELAKAVTWAGLVAILRRDRIPLVRTPLTKPAACLSLGGVTVILVNTSVPPRRHTYFVAHELAHAWLHADQETELCVHMDSDWADDPREDEAELVATWLLGDPDVRAYLDIPEPAIATLAPPGISLADALLTRKLVRGSDVPPRAPIVEPEPSLQKPDRVTAIAREIANAESLVELLQLRRRVLIECGNDERQRMLLREIDVCEDQLLEMLVWSTRRK